MLLEQLLSNMLSFLLIILLVFVLWPLVTGMWRIWAQVRSMRRFMADPEGEMRRRSGSRADANAQTPKKKKIARDVGEYVEFTEVESSYNNNTDGAPSSFIHEEQVTDVKWVDIK